ncbi:MAG: DNA cytosine methyltransferase [Deltaproteobacteria bacterium]|jgi:DNA (cytosine-5)-methyltransferase 1|nr:DNA cytosine methyltransferase [Deltaproteobacteria bacterium]
MQRRKVRDCSDNRDVISLFSGAMGLDIGLSQAGLRVRACQDLDPDCVATMGLNGHDAIQGDIRGIAPERILGAAGLKRGEPFLVCGGPPCQPFSTAGRRRGISDPRGSLFMDFLRMLDHMRPRFFIMENVKGLLSQQADEGFSPKGRTGGKARPESPLVSALGIILSQFEKLGYKTVHGVLDAVNYGVPQFRERFVLMGSRDGEDIFLPLPTHFQRHQNPAFRWVTLRDAIADLEGDPGECAAFKEERLALLRLVPEGGNWRSLPSDCVEGAMGGAYRSGGGKVGFYRRLSYDEPSPTLVTSPVQKASMLCHPVLDRPLGVREYSRLQQFPGNWRLHGGTSSKYRQLGNAVPVGLARALGEALLATANGDSTVRSKRCRGTDAHRRMVWPPRAAVG